MKILKNSLKVIGTIACIIYAVIFFKYLLPDFDKALIESAESEAVEQFESQQPSTGGINKLTLLSCKTIFVKNTSGSTEECRLGIKTNNSGTLNVGIIHEDDTFKYHNTEISIGDTIEYRIDNIDRSRRRFHQPAFRPDTIDSINGVAVNHKE